MLNFGETPALQCCTGTIFGSEFVSEDIFDGKAILRCLVGLSAPEKILGFPHLPAGILPPLFSTTTETHPPTFNTSSLNPAPKQHCARKQEYCKRGSTGQRELEKFRLSEPNRQKSRRKKGFWAQTSQAEIANRYRLSIAPLNRTATLLSLVPEIAAMSGVRDGHRNRRSQKSLRFRCAKFKNL